MKKSELKEFIKSEIIRELEEATYEVPAEELPKVKNQIGPDDDVKITEEDDAPEADKGVARRGNKLDRAIKDLRSVKKQLKTHLTMYKDAEGDRAKLAALRMLKKLTSQKNELDSLIKRLEGNVVK